MSDNWHYFESNIYAAISLEENVPIGLVEVTLGCPSRPSPGWWLDNDYREKRGYAKGMMDSLAVLLVEAGAKDIAGVRYDGPCYQRSEALGKYLKGKVQYLVSNKF